MNYHLNDEAAANLIHGSSKPAIKEKPFIDPLRHVDRSREHRTKSVSELVKSASEVCEAIDAARNEAKLLTQVLDKLVEIKMISGAEAAKAEIAKMSTISKYRKIDERREVLLHPNVANKICSGYTILYELSLLIDKLDEDDAAEQLAEHLAKLDGPLTRKWVQELREDIAPKKRRAKAKGPDDSATVAGRHEDIIESDAGAPIENDVESREGAVSDKPKGATIAALSSTQVNEMPVVSEQEAQLINELLTEVAVPADSADEAILLVQGSRGSLLSIRKMLLDQVAPGNIHIAIRGASTGWERIACDSEAGDLK